jgi:hypothetical protein
MKDRTCIMIHGQAKTELERSCQQNGWKKDPHKNSTVHASGQNIYRASGKKIAQDCIRPHSLTHVWKWKVVIS